MTKEFEYADLDGLETLLKENDGDVACIIITPVGHPLAKPVMEPPAGYLEGVRALADKYKVVLIFDEIRTGFRVAMGGAQEKYGVTPDLAVFGKAMANGYPISACVGKAEIMDVLESKVFVSSTFFPNSLEMVAALKCIEILERENVISEIYRKGERFLSECNRLIAKYDIPASMSGIPPMPFITFDKAGDYKARRVRFFTETIRRGLFIQPFHHGYIAHRHTEADIDASLKAIEEAFEVIAAEYPEK